MKTYKQFLNESHPTEINWEAIEAFYANQTDVPDCVPRNVREWDTFIKQYERACAIVDGSYKLKFSWSDDREKDMYMDEQLYLNKGYKRSVYECYYDLEDVAGNKMQHSEILYNNGFTWDPIESVVGDYAWIDRFESDAIPDIHSNELSQFIMTLKKINKSTVDSGFEPEDTIDYLRKKLNM